MYIMQKQKPHKMHPPQAKNKTTNPAKKYKSRTVKPKPTAKKYKSK